MLPQLRKLEHEFAPNLVVVGVHSPKFPAEKTDANLRKSVLRYDLEHPVVNDADFRIWQGYAVRAWPTLMIIDPRGRVIAKHEGEFDLDSMRDFLHGAFAAFAADGLLDPTPITLTQEVESTPGLRFPGKVLVDAPSDRLFIADSGHHRVILADRRGRVLNRFGTGEPGLIDGEQAIAAFTNPQGMALSPDGQQLYVADTGNHALRRIDLTTGSITTIAGTGERSHGYDPDAATHPLASPWDLAWFDSDLWIAMAGTHQLWRYRPANGEIAPAAGSGHESIHDGPLVSATFAQPSGITALDRLLYIADSETSAIRRVSPDEDRVRRLIGRGLFDFGDVDARGDSVRLQHPLGTAAREENGAPAVFIADSYNSKIKRLDPATRDVVTIAGSGEHDLLDGEADDAAFWEPGGLALDGDLLYVADTNNHAIRVVDLTTGMVRTLEFEGL